jgi:hypothetical protein
MGEPPIEVSRSFPTNGVLIHLKLLRRKDKSTRSSASTAASALESVVPDAVLPLEPALGGQKRKAKNAIHCSRSLNLNVCSL